MAPFRFIVKTVGLWCFLSVVVNAQSAHSNGGFSPDHSNFLCRKSGAKVVKVSSPSPPQFNAENIIADSLGAEGLWRVANKAKFPHWVVLELPKKQMITTMRVSTNALNEAEFEGITASVVKVEFSTVSPETGFVQVAREFLMKNKSDQIFNVAADSAKWIRLSIETNFDHPHFTELGRVYAYNDFALNQYEMAFSNEGKLDVHEIKFTENSFEITQESIPIIETVASVIRHHQEWEVMIEGHTDSDGDEEYNRELSQKRAEAVKELLFKLGIDEKLLQAVGKGESSPLVEETTDADKAQNRRVTFRVKNYNVSSAD